MIYLADTAVRPSPNTRIDHVEVLDHYEHEGALDFGSKFDVHANGFVYRMEGEMIELGGPRWMRFADMYLMGFAVTEVRPA